MVFDFLEFISESNKLGLPYFFSRKLSDFLFDLIKNTEDKDVKDMIYHIMDQESKKTIQSNFTFIDMSTKNDTISFIQSNRIFQMYKDLSIKGDFDDWIDQEKLKGNSLIWESSSRSEARIGKTFRKIISDGNKKFPDSTIEKFVNLYKSNFDFKFNIDDRFEVVTGEKIKFFYLESNYSGRGGHLSNSCMRYTTCQKFFDIYVENPEVCSLLVLYNSPKKEKISGRSLIWKCVDGSIYMDRSYTNKDSDINLFYDYAKSKKWAKEWRYDRRVQLKKWKFEKYPYMDTFFVLDSESGVLMSDENKWKDSLEYGTKMIYLRQTDGRYLTSDDLVWSEYSQDYILKNEAIYIESYDEWIKSEDAVYLEYLDEYVHPNENVYWSEYNQDYILEEDSVYSEYLGDNIFKKDSLKIIKSISNDKDEYDFIHSDFSNLIVTVNCYFPNGEIKKLPTILSFSMISPISRENYLIDNKIATYYTKIGYLTKEDSLFIGQDMEDGKEIWEKTQNYIHKISKMGKSSKEDVINYINKLKFTVDRSIINKVYKLFTQTWINNYRRSSIHHLIDKFNDYEISELVKDCLLNFDLSLKYRPTDLSRKNNPEIVMLFNEFTNRVQNYKNKLSPNSISKLYSLTEYLIPKLIVDTDILLSWYREIVFKQN